MNTIRGMDEILVIIAATLSTVLNHLGYNRKTARRDEHQPIVTEFSGGIGFYFIPSILKSIYFRCTIFWIFTPLFVRDWSNLLNRSPVDILSYYRAELKLSDHRPVLAHLGVGVIGFISPPLSHRNSNISTPLLTSLHTQIRIEDKMKRLETSQRIARDVDKAENLLMPQATLRFFPHTLIIIIIIIIWGFHWHSSLAWGIKYYYDYFSSHTSSSYGMWWNLLQL